MLSSRSILTITSQTFFVVLKFDVQIYQELIRFRSAHDVGGTLCIPRIFRGYISLIWLEML